MPQELQRVARRSAVDAAHLDALIVEGPLSVAFQPIVDLTTGLPMGYEVLGRCGAWTGPLSEACSSPSALLDMAHACGRLRALDRRWRTIAMDRIAATDRPGVRYFVNLDPRLADDPSHQTGFTLDLVRKKGLAPERFVLELTEHPSADARGIEATLQEYRGHGFGLAVDDLGASERSLTSLLRIRPEFIKVDSALVRGIEEDQHRKELLAALAQFARRVGSSLIAEGIETEAELGALREIGVTVGQGFLLGKPTRKPSQVSSRALAAIRASTSRRAGTRLRQAEDAWTPLLELVNAIGARGSLEPILRQVTAFSAGLLGVERSTIRLLDESRARLLVAGRSGRSLHEPSASDFAVGEGLVGWVVREREALRVAHAEADPRFAARPGQNAPVGSFMGVPLLDAQGSIGVLSVTDPGIGRFSEQDEQRLRVIAGIIAPRLELERLHRLTLTDPLTSTWNRRALDTILPELEVSLSESTAVLLVDVDRFKAINDMHGHAAGDAALRATAQLLVSTLRESDRVVRIGGDEFLIVLFNTSLEQARAIGQRASEAVRRHAFLGNETLSISVGVAVRWNDETRDELLARADAAMYLAKRSGRDCMEYDSRVVRASDVGG